MEVMSIDFWFWYTHREKLTEKKVSSGEEKKKGGSSNSNNINIDTDVNNIDTDDNNSVITRHNHHQQRYHVITSTRATRPPSHLSRSEQTERLLGQTLM